MDEKTSQTGALRGTENLGRFNTGELSGKVTGTQLYREVNLAMKGLDKKKANELFLAVKEELDDERKTYAKEHGGMAWSCETSIKEMDKDHIVFAFDFTKWPMTEKAVEAAETKYSDMKEGAAKREALYKEKRYSWSEQEGEISELIEAAIMAVHSAAKFQKEGVPVQAGMALEREYDGRDFTIGMPKMAASFIEELYHKIHSAPSAQEIYSGWVKPHMDDIFGVGVAITQVATGDHFGAADTISTAVTTALGVAMPEEYAAGLPSG